MEEEEHTKKNPRNQEKKRVPIGKQFHTSSMFKCQLPQYFLCYLKFFTILIFWCLFSPCSFFFYFSIWLSCMMMMKNDLIRKAKKKIGHSSSMLVVWNNFFPALFGSFFRRVSFKFCFPSSLSLSLWNINSCIKAWLANRRTK